MFEKLKTFLGDLLRRSPLGAGQPYIPGRPADTSDSMPKKVEPFYTETDSDIEDIAGTPIYFGTEKHTEVTANGSATHETRKRAHLLGSGRLVTGLEPRIIKDGIQLPSVCGVCYKCKEESAQFLAEGLISLEEAHRLALFDTDSAAQCDGCGRRDLCVRHCRPFIGADGTRANLCPDCTKAAHRDKCFQIALGILLSPVSYRKTLPPAHQGENHHE
jgi:hypothetical protein